MRAPARRDRGYRRRGITGSHLAGLADAARPCVRLAELLGEWGDQSPPEVKAGLEQIKWMPATNGGPGCYITFAEYDHRGYKGDFLTVRELRGGELHFRGYFRPQHPSNTGSPLLKQE